MAAASVTALDPIVVTGNIRLRTYNVTSVADTNTFAVIEFSTVIGAWLQPEVALTSMPGIALSGAGNKTLTFAMSATITAGKLFILGL
jgi:hypothetical protein